MKRLISHWNSEITLDDKSFISDYLDEPSHFLFDQMNKVDKLHAISVARVLLAENPEMDDEMRQIVIKAALLHDIGKVEGDFGFWSRILVGFIRRIQPTLRGRLAKRRTFSYQSRLRYSFYVDLVHPARGAHMAKLFGIEPVVVELIRRHHDPPRYDRNHPLTLLQVADSRN